MARAHFVTYLTDTNGAVIPGATVTVRTPDTVSPISETIYAEDDTSGNTQKANPFTADADGKVEIWLTVPKVVDLYVTKTGYDPRTIRATAHQLTSSTLTVADDGTPLAQRAGLNFIDGFTLTDDSVNNETEIRLDYAEVGDMPATAFGQANSAGALNEVARADHEHEMPANPVSAHEVTYDHADIALNETAIANHLADTVDAHDASAISFTPVGSIAASDVQAAIAEVDSEKAASGHTHSSSVPAGSIFAFGGTSAPAGYLMCDGTAVNRTTYSALFTAIGTNYGVGNGSTTFNLPDLRQRFPMGKADAGTGSTLGGTGGTVDHAHSTPAGTSGSEASHTHGVSGTTTGPSSSPSNMTAGGSTQYAGAAHNHDLSATSGAGSSHSHSTPSGTSGTGNPPFQTVNYIIAT